MEDSNRKNQNLVPENNSIPEDYKEHKHKTKYEKFNIPGHIQIGKYKYTYKNQSKADPDIFTYRCQKLDCKIPISINRENLNKINNKSIKDTIEYIMKKEHKCILLDNTKVEKIENCDSEKELIKRAENLIKLNPLKPLSYHMNILNEQNIILGKEKINRIITKIRNSIYPQDSDFIKNINLIQITFDQSIENAKNIPFCPIYTKFINHLKKNREEQYIIFTSIFHLKFLEKCSQIFIDGTFKSSLKNFYQILNILAYNEKEFFYA